MIRPSPHTYAGRVVYPAEIGLAKTILSDLVLVAEVRDDSNAVVMDGALVPKRHVFAAPDKSVLFPRNAYLAEWDGVGLELANFTLAPNMTLGRLVESKVAPADGLIAYAHTFEIIATNAPGDYGSVGDQVLVRPDLAFFFDENYAFLPPSTWNPGPGIPLGVVV